jgi:hypothetical protein
LGEKVATLTDDQKKMLEQLAAEATREAQKWAASNQTNLWRILPRQIWFDFLNRPRLWYILQTDFKSIL